VDLGSLVDEIVAARRSKSALAPPSHQLPGFSIEDGYAVARRLHELRLAAGSRVAGVKLGFTNRAVWEALGLTDPFWSPVYDDTVTTGRDVSLEDFVAPRIEAEIVLGFSSRLPRNASIEAICAATGWAAPGFEIVQCHYPDWVMAPADAIADAGLHGVLVVGERQPGPFDPDALASTTVELMRGDVAVARGTGSAVLGGPAEAVGWLLRLPGMEGLPAGSIVTTGTLTGAHPVVAGETWRSDCAGPSVRGRLEVTFG
jgi:2-keto-4-pentenoate hydratase